MSILAKLPKEKIISLALALFVCCSFLFLMFGSLGHFNSSIKSALKVHFVASQIESNRQIEGQEKQLLRRIESEIGEKKSLQKIENSSRQNIHLHSDLSENSLNRNENNQSSEAALTKDNLVIFSPLPQIPYDLRREAFECDAQAKFTIANDGGVAAVNLVKLCQNPKLNSLLLRSLKQWKFKPEAASTTRNIKVKFIVE